MSLTINGIEITRSDDIIVNSIPIHKVYANDKLVWTNKGYIHPGGNFTITASGTFIAGIDFPADVPLHICMVGGGGSGRADSNYPGSGGYAGAVVTGSITLAYNESIEVTIGSGGPASRAPFHKDGTPTIFGSYFTAAGGAREGYWGYGKEVTTCGGTGHDGYSYCVGKSGGGQSSGFSHGGTASCHEESALAGGVGSGGGGTGYCYTNAYSGGGGRGQVNISWDEYESPYEPPITPTIPSPLVIEQSGTFIAGIDFPADKTLTVCMVGGGGSGRANSNGAGSGGYAGEVVSTNITVPNGEVVTATIGLGGPACQEPLNHGGTPTRFGSYVTAAGGAGEGYYGYGEEVTTCGGTGHDGYSNCGSTSGGGQSSGFSDGGMANCTGGSAGAGGAGSGGGGTGHSFISSYSGGGGRGKIIISWEED